MLSMVTKFDDKFFGYFFGIVSRNYTVNQQAFFFFFFFEQILLECMFMLFDPLLPVQGHLLAALLFAALPGPGHTTKCTAHDI